MRFSEFHQRVRQILETALLSSLLVGLMVSSCLGQKTSPVHRGQYILQAAGGCSCHTDFENKGAFLAGGRAIKTPFGRVYSTNITPDPETGIGKWSDEDFITALRKGVSPKGTQYYPVFPYTSFTRITDKDMLDLKAYLFSVPPVKQENKPPDMNPLFGWRSVLVVWKWLYFRSGPFQPDAAQSREWNRGAYLSTAPGHCTECHTPRNFMGGQKARMYYAGSVDGPEGQLAPNITPDKETGIGKWSIPDLVWFLQTGLKPDGNDAQGLMREVIENGFQFLTEADLQAIAVYLRSLKPIHNPIIPPGAKHLVSTLGVRSIWLYSLTLPPHEGFGKDLTDRPNTPLHQYHSDGDVLGKGRGLIAQRQTVEAEKNKENPLLAEEYVSMNFDDADIRVVIKYISDLTGKSFIVDDRIKGKVTLVSPSKVSVQEAYKIFESMLEVKGYTTIGAGKIIKIVPAAEAPSRAVPTKADKDVRIARPEDEMVTRIVPLEHAGATELSSVLRPFLAEKSKVLAYPETNTLVLTDYSSNIGRLMRIIKEIDVKISDEMILVVPLVHASANTVAAKLKELIQQRPKPSISKVVPDERTNSLIILANVQDTKRILKQIDELDRPTEKR